MKQPPISIDADSDEKPGRKRRPAPAFSLEPTLAIASAIAQHNNGRPYSRLLLADAIGRKPDSSAFRLLITASGQYGMTSGGYSAERISLTPRGTAITMPKTNSERDAALVEAVRSIPVFNKVANHFEGAKLPTEELFRNLLIREFEVPAERATETAKNFIADARFVGILQTIAGEERVFSDNLIQEVKLRSNGHFEAGSEPDGATTPIQPTSDRKDTPAPVGSSNQAILESQGTQKIFITHGSNSAIVIQIKEILKFGKYTPVVAEESESTAIPVPEKVLNSMRASVGGIIHVENERELFDGDGETVAVLNPNLLIEIGAAMALYGKNFVLLVRKGVTLPSNLQGLYRCDYEGDKLDFDATMKLLQIFNKLTL